MFLLVMWIDIPDIASCDYKIFIDISNKFIKDILQHKEFMVKIHNFHKFLQIS